MNSTNKIGVIFVGCFDHKGTKDGSMGGQMYASLSLIASGISDHVEWALLDSTAETVFPVPSLRKRAYKAHLRVWRFLKLVIKPKNKVALIFVSHGLSFMEKGTMVFLARLFGKKAILFPRSGLVKVDVINSKLYRWFFPLVLKAAHTIVCQSNSWKDFYQQLTNLPDHRFTVVRNWYDMNGTPEFESNTGKSTGSKEKLTILYLGWVKFYKGILDLIEAVHTRKEAFDQCEFIICGDGSALQTAKKLVVQYGLDTHFKFLGWVRGHQKSTILRDADIFVLPSHYEGSPNALLEAMAVGKTCIAAAVGAIPETIQHGENGLLFKPGDVASLADLMLQLKNNPEDRRLLGQNAIKSVATDHDIEQTWPEILKIIQDTVRN